MGFSKLLPVSILILIFAALAGVLFFNSQSFQSVEFGLAELSPKGPEGGYAMPASGGSTPSLYYNCSDSGEEVTLYWTPSFDVQGHDHGTITYNLRIDNLVDGWRNASCSGQSSNDVCVNGLTSTSWTGSVIPGQTYEAWIHGCSGGTTVSGGGCSSGATNIQFTCNAGEDSIPTVNLEVKNTTTDSDWTGEDITINSGEELSLRWESNNTASCEGQNFSTGNLTDGTQSNVTEPASGTNELYLVACTSSSDSTISVYDWLYVTVLGEGPEIETDPPIVDPGDEVEVIWDTGDVDPGECTIAGPGLNISLTENTGSEIVTVYNESTYVIDCGVSGNDEVTVEVLPVIQET